MFLYCLTNGLILREFVSRFPESYAIMLNLAFCIRLMLAYCVAFELLRRWQTRSWFRYYFFLTMTFWVVQVIAVSFGKIVPFFLLINWLILFTAPIFGTFAIYQSETLSRSSKLYWLAGLLTICLLFGAEAFLLASGAGNSIVTLLPYSATSLLAALSIYLMLLGYTKAQQEQWLQTMFDFNVLKTQNDYEQRQLKDRSTLIDMLSHELKNPLATMRMALGSLKALFGRSENEPELNDRFLSLNQSIDNMTSVIDRVRQVDAIDQKNFVLRYEPCNVIETIASLPLVVEHSDRLNILGSRQISINVDRLLFVTIINNLVDNAIKYSAPESAIEVSVSALSNNKLLCAISNAVENDHAPDATALFTRYYRGVYSHDKPGTGLGLVLIRSLCDILKGSIHYRFDYNRVFFVVELPL
jgi:signal transduction histidine kinase